MKNVRVKHIIIIPLLCLLACSKSDQGEVVILTLDEKVAASEITITLTSNKQTYVLGELPEIEVALINNSKKIINLITSLDGSSDSMRYPLTGFQIFRNDTLLQSTNWRCGNMDGLNLDRIKTVQPGQSLDPEKGTPWVYRDHSINDSIKFSKRGKYLVQYYYSTNQDSLSEWLGWNAHWSLLRLPKKERTARIEAYQLRFKSMPRLDLISEPIEFDIK